MRSRREMGGGGGGGWVVKTEPIIVIPEIGGWRLHDTNVSNCDVMDTLAMRNSIYLYNFSQAMT